MNAFLGAIYMKAIGIYVNQWHSNAYICRKAVMKIDAQNE